MPLLLILCILLIGCQPTEQIAMPTAKSKDTVQDSAIYFFPEEYTKIKGELYVSDMSYKGKYPIVDSTRKDSVVYFSSTFKDYHKCYRKYPIVDNNRKDSTVCMVKDSLVYKNSKLLVITYFTIRISVHQEPYSDDGSKIKDHFTANEDYVFELGLFPSIVKQVLYFYTDDRLVKVSEYRLPKNVGVIPSYCATKISQIYAVKGTNGWIWETYGYCGGNRDGSQETMYYTTSGEQLFYGYYEIVWEKVDTSYIVDNTASVFEHLGISEKSLDAIRTDAANVANFDYP